jgi:Raf kinase inhibitor-like YbhB/YbcL family protein
MNLLGLLMRPLRAGIKHLAWNRLEPAQESISVTSTAFADGGAIPPRYAGVGQNVSPPLRISGVPRGTAELVIIVEDPDAPLPRPIVHLIARLPGTTTSVTEGGLMPGHAVFFGEGSFGRYGYAGPRPVKGHGPHRYVFQVFAVGRTLEDVPGTDLKAYLASMRGHILARGKLTGTFERR